MVEVHGRDRIPKSAIGAWHGLQLFDKGLVACDPTFSTRSENLKVVIFVSRLRVPVSPCGV
jgi:hypothetical protein